MGRYRPPSAPKTPYITAAGFKKLQAEEKALWLRRRDVTKALTAAAAEGDRSENAEYIYRKKELRELDRRIRYLQKRLPSLNVVNNPPTNAEQIFFAAWITLEKENRETVRYRIVGPDETDDHPAYISIDSPLARALLKRQLDDEVWIKTPAGETAYLVIEIEYE